MNNLNLNVGKLLGQVVQIFDGDSNKIDKLVEKLSSMNEGLVTPDVLTEFVPDNRTHLLFDILQHLNVITTVDTNSGNLIVDRISWLEPNLKLVIGAMSSSLDVAQASKPVELAWTLPYELFGDKEIEPIPRSLVTLIKYAISRARDTLYLISPFLNEPGAQLLAGALKGAYKRGVSVYLISHENPKSDDHTLNVYREAVPNINLYLAPSVELGEKYLLLHAKLVIADDTFAVLGSANLTSYGLGTHLEIGLGVEGQIVPRLKELSKTLIKSELVRQIKL